MLIQTVMMDMYMATYIFTSNRPIEKVIGFVLCHSKANIQVLFGELSHISFKYHFLIIHGDIASIEGQHLASCYHNEKWYHLIAQLVN